MPQERSGYFLPFFLLFLLSFFLSFFFDMAASFPRSPAVPRDSEEPSQRTLDEQGNRPLTCIRGDLRCCAWPKTSPSSASTAPRMR